MSLELTGVHGLLKRHKLFTHKYNKSRRTHCLKVKFSFPIGMKDRICPIPAISAIFHRDKSIG